MSLKPGWLEQGSTSFPSMSEEIPEAAEMEVKRMSPEMPTSLVSHCKKESRSEEQEKDSRMWTQAGWKGWDMRGDQAEDSLCAAGSSSGHSSHCLS